MTVAKLIADARKKSGLSLNQLANKAGVPRSTAYSVEIGRTSPRFSDVCILARALKLPIRTACEEALAEHDRRA